MARGEHPHHTPQRLCPVKGETKSSTKHANMQPKEEKNGQMQQCNGAAAPNAVWTLNVGDGKTKWQSRG